MTDQELLNKVKSTLMITGSEFDATLIVHILGAWQYMINTGVPERLVYSESGVVAIAIGANDLWNLAAGEAKFSPAFVNMVLQLRHVVMDSDGEVNR